MPAALIILALLRSVVVTRGGHCLKLAAQALDLIQHGRLISLRRAFRLSWFPLSDFFLRLSKLLVQLLQSLRDLALSAVRVRIDSAAQPVRSSLHMVVEVGLVHLRQRIA